MRIIEVTCCTECPYNRRGYPHYCVLNHFDLSKELIENGAEIHKGCKLKTLDEIIERKMVYDEEDGMVKEVIKKPNEKKSLRDVIRDKEKPENGWNDEDGWWEADSSEVIKQDTDKTCILCGNILDEDIKEMEHDNKIIKVHIVCYENMKVLVNEENNKDDEEMIKKNEETKEEDGKWNDGW